MTENTYSCDSESYNFQQLIPADIMTGRLTHWLVDSHAQRQTTTSYRDSVPIKNYM